MNDICFRGAEEQAEIPVHLAMWRFGRELEERFVLPFPLPHGGADGAVTERFSDGMRLSTSYVSEPLGNDLGRGVTVFNLRSAEGPPERMLGQALLSWPALQGEDSVPDPER